MRIAFVGKGGSGKTTVSSLFIRRLAETGRQVVAIDADINQHLGAALGLHDDDIRSLPTLGYNLDDIKRYLKGDNERIESLDLFLKSTPPARGSRLLRAGEPNPIFDTYSTVVKGVRLMSTGLYDEQDIGVRCYHGKQGSAEIVLNHLLDGEDEFVAVDLTAGADSFASGIFLKFDMTFLIAEPTTKSLGVYAQYKQYAASHNIAVRVIGNKVEDEDDEQFIRQHVGDDYFGTMGRSRYVKQMERGEILPLGELEPANLRTLDDMIAYAQRATRDWKTYHKNSIRIHTKKAEQESDAVKRTKLLQQIDEQFIYE